MRTVNWGFAIGSSVGVRMGAIHDATHGDKAKEDGLTKVACCRMSRGVWVGALNTVMARDASVIVMSMWDGYC